MFGKMYDLENFLSIPDATWALRVGRRFFDTGLKNIKEEDDEYDEETIVKEEKISDNLSEDLEDTSWTVRIARNQEELDSIYRSTLELLKLDKFYNQDPLRYLHEGDSDFKDLDVGHMVTKTGVFRRLRVTT